MITVVRGKIAELARTPLLAGDEPRRANALGPAAAAAFVAGRTLVRHLLGRWLERDPAALTITGGGDDKPCLHGERTPIGFSVAHAGELVVAAVAPARNIGVDVEPEDPRRDVAAIAEAALGPDAAFELAQLPPDRRAARFTIWWVRVEALCKATGAGLMFPVETTAPGFAVRDLAMPRGYRGAVAFDGPPPRITAADWSPA